MKNLTRYIWALGASMFALMPLTSCSNEEAVPQPFVDDAPEGYATVNIVIPNMVAESRAQSLYANDTEVSIYNNDLYLCAFKIDERDIESELAAIPWTTNPAETAIIQLKNTDSSSSTIGNQSSPTWVQYPITLKEGYYHIYVLANLNEYTSDAIENLKTATNKQESTVETLKLDFSTFLNGTTKGIDPAHLPMACKYDEIKRGTENTAVSGGKFLIKRNDNNTIYASMSMLCAKVRYTVLFDYTETNTKTNFSTYKGVDYRSVSAGGVRKETYLYTGETSSYLDSELSGLPLKRYAISTDTETTLFNSYYNWDPSPSAEPLEDFSTNFKENWTDNAGEEKRVWQGTVYLPENTIKAPENNYPYIKFTPETNSNLPTPSGDKGIFTFDLDKSQNNPKVGLVRGNYYDVIARVQNPSTYMVSLTVYVQVKPWIYNTDGIKTW